MKVKKAECVQELSAQGEDGGWSSRLASDSMVMVPGGAQVKTGWQVDNIKVWQSPHCRHDPLVSVYYLQKTSSG